MARAKYSATRNLVLLQTADMCFAQDAALRGPREISQIEVALAADDEMPPQQAFAFAQTQFGETHLEIDARDLSAFLIRGHHEQSQRRAHGARQCERQQRHQPPQEQPHPARPVARGIAALRVPERQKRKRLIRADGFRFGRT
jgi:hypothetical protein